MKKILSLILVLASLLTFAACSKEEETKAPADKKEESFVVEGEKTETNEEPSTEETNEEESEEEEEEGKNTVEDEKPGNTPSNGTTENQPSETPTTPAPETDQSVGNTLLSDFKSKASSHSSALSLAEALATNSAIADIGCGAIEVEPGYLTGFDNTEIKGFKEGAMFAPMIGTIPFVGYVFILEDGASTSDFISTLKSAANLRWNICTSADEMVTGSSGNKVFFVMSPTSFEEN